MGIGLLIWGFVQRGFTNALTFFSKPPGTYIGIAIAIMGGLWWFGHLRYAAGIAATAALAAARSAQVKAKQDAAIQAVSGREDARAVVAAKQDAQTQEAVVNVEKSAAVMPNSSGIAITADVADRLRDIK